MVELYLRSPIRLQGIVVLIKYRDGRVPLSQNPIHGVYRDGRVPPSQNPIHGVYSSVSLTK
jgi:hypothetical protein